MATAKKATAAKRTGAESDEFTEDNRTIEVPFIFEKQTASARSPKLRFKEDDADGPTLVVGSLYMNKSTVDKYGEPTITVLVEWPS